MKLIVEAQLELLIGTCSVNRLVACPSIARTTISSI
jgi:hypothetical protein